MRCFRYRRKHTKQSRLNHISYKEQNSIQNISNIQTYWKYINKVTLKYLRIHTKQQLTLRISSQTPRYTKVAYQKERQEKKADITCFPCFDQRLNLQDILAGYFWQHTLLCPNHLYPSESWFGHPMMSNLSCYDKVPSCLDMGPHDCAFPYAS